METCKSPRTVMRLAYQLACEIWPNDQRHSSQHDFTLAQEFACLAVREMLKLSYRKCEAFLRDSPDWLADIGSSKPPDHNTLWRAFGRLTTTRLVDRMLDLMSEQFKKTRELKLSSQPLTIDSTCYEQRHRSKHYDRVCRKMGLSEGEKYAKTSKKPVETPAQVNRRRSRAVRQMPKLALAVASSCHLILAARAHIGNGSDMPDFQPLLRCAGRRAKVRVVVADAGYDSEMNHDAARIEMGVRSIIPPRTGRPSPKPPTGRFRRLMKQRFARKADRKHYGQRSQSETVNSMMKRNFGDALRSIKPRRRKQEVLLRSLIHDLMLLAKLNTG
jgi:IS5 family transposase